MGIPKYVSAEEYSKKSGLGLQEVKRQCRIGKLEHIMTEGGHYKVITESDTIPRKKYEELQKENAKLKTIVSTILQTARMVT